jgi:hypothetical protein
LPELGCTCIRIPSFTTYGIVSYRIAREVKADFPSEEIEEETAGRMEVIQGNQEQQFSELADLLDAELEYFTKCRDILEELREQWPSG